MADHRVAIVAETLDAAIEGAKSEQRLYDSDGEAAAVIEDVLERLRYLRNGPEQIRAIIDRVERKLPPIASAPPPPGDEVERVAEAAWSVVHVAQGYKPMFFWAEQSEQHKALWRDVAKAAIAALTRKP